MRTVLALIAGAAMLLGCQEEKGQVAAPAPPATKDAPPAANAPGGPPVAPTQARRTEAPPAAPPTEVVKKETPPPVPADTSAFKEVFPHVRVDAQAKAVQFDGVVPIDAHDANAPFVFLEVVVCSPDTKEHEALVMTQAKASHVHAALLLIGLKPGTPGRWKFEGGELKSIPPTGDEVNVTLTYRGADGAEKSVTPQELIGTAKDDKQFGAGGGGGGKWVFAGSQIVQREGHDWYDADGAGTLVGLTTFGSETIAWSEMISPEASVQEPEWVARRATPPAGTPIVVTIRPVK